MIKATMYWSRLRMEIEGHAGYAEEGGDIVCAGASALVEALVGVLHDAEQRGRTTADAEERDNKLIIWADPNMGSLNEIKAYFRVCVKGLQLLQSNYRDNVGIKEVL